MFRPGRAQGESSGRLSEHNARPPERNRVRRRASGWDEGRGLISVSAGRREASRLGDTFY